MTTKPRTRKPIIEKIRERIEDRPAPLPKARRGGHTATFNLQEMQGSTRQTCGYWPFVNGSAAPIHGAQIGRHLFTDEPIGCDPLSWFDAGYIGNPSMFLLSNPGLGKSSFIRKMEIGVMARGGHVLVLGDRKGEHLDLIRRFGGRTPDEEGSVISLGPGEGKLNILDPGGVIEAAEWILAESEVENAQYLHDRLIDRMHARRLAMLTGLVGISRPDKPVTGHERSILNACLKHLHEHHEGAPIISDVLTTLRDKSNERVVTAVNAWKTEGDHYRDIINDLENALLALTDHGSIGEPFNGQTTMTIHRDRSTAFDISGIDAADKEMLSAAYIACWSAGFGMIDVAHALADAGLEKNRRYFAVLDEFWQPLGASPGMVDRVDAITRLNRDQGVGIVYASHTLSDLKVANESDRAKAEGFVDRAGAVILGALRKEELTDRVSRVVDLRPEEIRLITSWNASPSLAANATAQPMPGRGKFLAKVDESPGVPINMAFTQTETDLGIHDTNKRIRREQETAR